MSRNNSNCLVRVLDMKPFCQMVLGYLISVGMDFEDNIRIKPFADLGIVKDKNGKHYLINTEGCGSTKAIEDEKVAVEFYKETVNDKGEVTSFEIFPFVRVNLTSDDLDSTPDKGMKPLHEFVRTFGDRLDANFQVWDRFLTIGK